MNRIKKIIKILKWNFQLSRIRYVDSDDAYNFDLFSKILIIVPHADDELIGCYHLLKKYKDKITLFFCNYVGTNDDENNKLTREKEFIEFCKSNDLRFIISNNVNNDLKSYLSNNNVDLILLTPLIDWHEEHRRVNDILYHLLQSSIYKGYIGWYQISVPLLESNVKIRFTRNDKKEMEKDFVYYYPSQSNLPIQRFNINRKIYSKNRLFFFYENYYIFSKNTFEIFFKNYKKADIQKINDLKQYINHINVLNFKSKSLYEKIILGGK